jgi:hypothetical protein
MCTASAVSATRMRRNICGPWLDDGPRDMEMGAVASMDPRLLLIARDTAGTARALVAIVDVVAAVAARSGFLAMVVRDGRRWILFSRIRFCWTGSGR